MSIIIKGMKMPYNCDECELCAFIPVGDYGIIRKCMPLNAKAEIIIRRPNCPLVHVPPHGRLIDADKQDAQIEALIERHLHGYTKSTWDFVCELRDILKRNSTIIKAEGEET